MYALSLLWIVEIYSYNHLHQDASPRHNTDIKSMDSGEAVNLHAHIGYSDTHPSGPRTFSLRKLPTPIQNGNDVSSPSENVVMLEALYDFQGVQQDDLPFKVGDVVTLLRPHSAGRWKVQRVSDGAIGAVPSGPGYFVSNLSSDIGFKFLI